jgi:hypothetical protein
MPVAKLYVDVAVLVDAYSEVEMVFSNLEQKSQEMEGGHNVYKRDR